MIEHMFFSKHIFFFTLLPNPSLQETYSKIAMLQAELGALDGVCDGSASGTGCQVGHAGNDGLATINPPPIDMWENFFKYIQMILIYWWFIIALPWLPIYMFMICGMQYTDTMYSAVGLHVECSLT